MPSAHHALGLTAVILCGEGSDLKPIISTHKLPKALLPVANKPMLQYPLEWVLDAGLDSVVIVCIKGQEPPIRSFVKEIYAIREAQTPVSKNTRPLREPVVVGGALPGSKAGTAEVLRQPQVYNLIKNDFMVLSCDSICEIPAATIIKEWMLLPDTLGNRTGALGVWYDVQKQKGTERDVILSAPIPRFDLEAGLRSAEARTDQTTELSYLLQNFGSRLEDFKDDIVFRRSIFKRHPKLMLQDGYRDAFIYIFPHWALKFILANPRNKLKSIKDDVLSWWAKACWQGSGLQAHNLGLLRILEDKDEDNDGQKSDGLSMASFQEEEVTGTSIENFLGMSSMRTSSWPVAAKGRKEINTRGWFPNMNTAPSPTDSPTSSDSQEKEFQKIKLPAYNGLFVPGIAVFKPQMTITPLATTPLIRRVDTLTLYLSTCLELARNTVYNANAIHSTATVHERANVSSVDSMVGAGTRIDEKTLIKRSVVGKNVKIGKLAKIQGCVILDGAEVADGCKLEGCIIGRFAKIGANSSLTACQVVEDVELRERTVEKDQLITQSSDESFSEEEEEDIFGTDGGTADAQGEPYVDDEDDDEDEDTDEDEDDRTTTKSVPTTTKESVAPISALSRGHAAQLEAIPTASVPSSKDVVATSSVPESTTETVAEVAKETKEAQEAKEAKEVKEEINEKNEAAEEQVVEAAEQIEEGGPTVPFLQLELEEEEEEEEEDDFEPESDESSYCDEEYDSQFESDNGFVSGDDTGNLSGPEEDGGPLKSPKRMSRNFGEEMTKSMAQIAQLNLGVATDEKVDEEVRQAMNDTLPEPVEVEGAAMKIEQSAVDGEGKGN
ncbi:hypothetical protein ABW20_dc0103624 [Dactylellina cionopaga]|nr:hypothetical protein ABW20_dc0103624 [Dactylellina cionopaga]